LPDTARPDPTEPVSGPPSGRRSTSTVSGGPAARDAVLLPSGVQKLWEVRRRSSRAGLPVSAPRSPRALKSAPQPELWLGSYSWTSEEQASIHFKPGSPWNPSLPSAKGFQRQSGKPLAPFFIAMAMISP
ncbi:hypothetical protein E2I00_009274, partial [Balaenoptera physalus]